MKKFLGNVTDWIGWFFVEVADKMFGLTSGAWAWRADGEEVRWFLRPYNWFAGWMYSLGNWFYGLFDDFTLMEAWRGEEPFEQHHGVSALDLANRINAITCEIMSRCDVDSTQEERDELTDEFLTTLMSEAHWLSHEFECRLGGHGGTEYATGPLLEEVE